MSAGTRREISRFVMSARGTRQFSTESEINSPGDFEKVLNISSNAGGMTVTVYNDKVNIKGEITADIAYIVKDRPGDTNPKQELCV